MITRLLPLVLVPLFACSTPSPTPHAAPTTVPPASPRAAQPATAAEPPPVVTEELLTLVATFLTQSQSSVVDATQTLGTAAFQQRALEEDAECKRGAAEHRGEVPPCGSDRFTFGWQEPLELASVDVVKHAGDTMTVRANMRYPEGFLDTPADDPPHFFAQLDLVRVDGAWRVDDARYDDDAVLRDRGVAP